MSKKNLLYSLLFLSSAVALFFFPAALFGKTYFIRDLTYIFHPWRSFAAESIITGQIPLWNPYAYCGMPFMANWQSAVFYPFSILFYLLPFYLAVKFYYFIHIFIAGYFTYLFARKNKYRALTSLGMMTMFAFNGFLMTKLEFLSHAGVDAWAFALLLFMNSPMLLALTTAIAFMAGHQIFAFQMMVVSLFILTDGVVKKKLAYNLKTIAVVSVVSLCIVAIQLLPTLELINYSNRLISGIDLNIAMLHSLKLTDFIRLFYPSFNADPLMQVTGEKYQWDTTIYVGLTVFLIAVCGLFSKKLMYLKIFSFFLVAAGFVFALGDSTAVYPFLYRHVVIFKTMRYPVQFMFMAIIGLTFMFGLGFDSLYKVLKKHILFGIILLIFVELFIYGHNFQPLAENNFYYKKHDVVGYLEKNLGNDRFILSPGTEKNRYISGKDVRDAWQKTRGYLFNLTSMPYHINNAYGFGEPLTLKSVEDLVDNAYRQKTPQELLPFLGLMDVRYLLCRKPLENTAGYNLVFKGDILIYETASNTQLTEPAGKEGLIIDIISKQESKIIMNIVSPASATVIFKEAFMPGWQAYLIPANAVNENKKIKISKWSNIFRSFEAPKGENRIIQYYNPLSYRLGVLITILMLFALAMIYSIKLNYWCFI